MDRDKDAKILRATAFFLQHPDASIRDAAKQIPEISVRTIAQARSNLAARGLMPAGRGRKRKEPAPAAPQPVATDETPSPVAGALLTDEKLRAIADPKEDISTLIDLDDEETRKQLLREVKKLAFSPDVHPDTKLSATTAWLRLKDMARSRELGPGKPLTRAVAVSRLSDLNKAIADIGLCVEALLTAYPAREVVAAIYNYLDIKEPDDEGDIPTDPGEAAPGADGTAQTPGSETLLRSDQDSGANGVGLPLPSDEHSDQGGRESV